MEGVHRCMAPAANLRTEPAYVIIRWRTWPGEKVPPLEALFVPRLALIIVILFHTYTPLSPCFSPPLLSLSVSDQSLITTQQTTAPFLGFKRTPNSSEYTPPARKKFRQYMPNSKCRQSAYTLCLLILQRASSLLRASVRDQEAAACLYPSPVPQVVEVSIGRC